MSGLIMSVAILSITGVASVTGPTLPPLALPAFGAADVRAALVIVVVIALVAGARVIAMSERRPRKAP